MRAATVAVCLVLCHVSNPSGAEAQQLRTVTYASGFSAPIAFEQDPSDPAMQYVAEQLSLIHI